MLDRSGLGASRYEEVVARMERVANFRLDAAAAEAGAGGGGASLINSSILTQGMENFLKVRTCFRTSVCVCVCVCVMSPTADSTDVPSSRTLLPQHPCRRTG